MPILIRKKSVLTRAIPAKCVQWMKRFGLLGFLFFLTKGIMWLLVPTALYYFNAN